MSERQLRLDFEAPVEPIPHPTQPGNLPTWIARQLHQISRSSNRAITFHHCHRCGAIVATGLDADTLARTATIDPTPITPAAELACLILARPTYTAWPTMPGWELTARDHHWYRRTPPHRLIVPAHQCGRRFPGFITSPAVDYTNPGPPPF